MSANPYDPNDDDHCHSAWNEGRQAHRKGLDVDDLSVEAYSPEVVVALFQGFAYSKLQSESAHA